MRFKFFISNGFAAAQDELPRMAVREAMVNAVGHCDCESSRVVQMMRFRDRLDIMNPGTLPRGWTAETLLTTHESVARNKVIAKKIGVTRMARSLKMALDTLLEDGLVEYTIPDNVRSRL